MTNRYRITLTDGTDVIVYADSPTRCRREAERRFGRIAAVVAAGGL